MSDQQPDDRVKKLAQDALATEIQGAAIERVTELREALLEASVRGFGKASECARIVQGFRESENPLERKLASMLAAEVEHTMNLGSALLNGEKALPEGRGALAQSFSSESGFSPPSSASSPTSPEQKALPGTGQGTIDTPSLPEKRGPGRPQGSKSKQSKPSPKATTDSDKNE